MAHRKPKTKVERVAQTSADIANENLQKLRTVFPQFVKDGEVDFDALKAFFDKEGIATGPEKYGLSWAGKNDAIAALQTPATGTLAPDMKESRDWDATQNIFIEGDNLEVLKLLQARYRGEIKMIYIDPPYNTGKDFIYKDNFTEGLSDYYERTGQSREGVKLTANLESNGRYHSDWLTSVYPRLFLAKNLLKNDGVIFVSIDDHEAANLRLVMDEIFGEENLLGQLVHQRAKGGGQAKQIVKGHDYILAYARNVNSGVVLRRAKVVQQDIVERNGKEYLRNDDVLRKTFGKYDKSLGDRRCFYEDIEKYKGKDKKREIDERISRGELVLEKNGKGVHIIVEYILLDEASSKLYSIIKVLSEEGKYDLEELNIIGFEYPKPVQLVSHLIQATTLDTKAEQSSILDFFAGSGTTAHAVMAQNAEDGGNRKWICVQLPEETGEESEARKAGYKNIAELARERIRRAGEKIGKGDVGFRAFTLAQSNYRRWNVLTEKDDPKKLLAQEKMFLEKPLVDGYDERAVVYEILLKEGFSLNAKVVQKQGALKPWVVEDAERKLFVTFASKVTKEQVEALGLTEHDLFVCLDSALDDSTKVNLLKGLKVRVKVI